MSGTNEAPAAASTTGLGRAATRGASVTMAGQVVRITVQLAGVVVMARLLDPSDYGLLAMVTAIIGVAEIFRDFGLASAAIQAKTLSRGQQSNLFWINSGIGVALALIVVAASGPIAALYGDDRLQLLTVVLASTFLFSGISTQFRAHLTRNLKFFRLSAVDIVAQVVGLGVGITMGLLDFGYWSLAGQQVSQAFVQIVVLLFVSSWHPGWIDRTAPMRSFLRFGINLFGVQLVNYFSRNTDSVVIGAQFGAGPLGLYNRAFQLMLLPLNQINAPSTRIALPILSRLQDDREKYAAFISFGQTVMLNIVGSVLALCGAQAGAIIDIAIGHQWAASVPIFQILLIAAFFQTASYAVYWVFLSKGLTRANLYYALITRPVMVVMIVFGATWGVTGVAWAYSTAIAVMWPIGLLWVGRVSDAPVKALFLNGCRMVVIYGAATVISFVSTLPIPASLPLVKILVGMGVIVAVLAFFSLVWPQFRRDVIAILGARRYLRRTRSSQPRSDARDEDAQTDTHTGEPAH